MTSIPNTINHLRPLISNQPSNPSPSMISFPSASSTTLPRKTARKQIKPHSSTTTLPAIHHLRPLISSQPTNSSPSIQALNSSIISIPTTPTTILQSKPPHQQFNTSSSTNITPTTDRLQLLISNQPINPSPSMTSIPGTLSKTTPSKTTHQQNKSPPSTTPLPAINCLRPLISSQPAHSSQLTPTFDTSSNSIPSIIPAIVPNKRKSLPRNPSSANHPAPQPLNINKRRTIGDDEMQEAVENALDLLRDEFKLNRVALEGFPPEITSSHIRSSISKYEDEISCASKRSICCSCGKFFPTVDVYRMDDKHDLILPLQGNLDSCGHDENTWIFCPLCYTALNQDKI